MLAETPERASVEALRAVLDVTVLALIAANPELLDDGWSATPERAQIPCLRVAHRILGHGHDTAPDPRHLRPAMQPTPHAVEAERLLPPLAVVVGLAIRGNAVGGPRLLALREDRRSTPPAC
jgi:hypothetical protein